MSENNPNPNSYLPYTISDEESRLYNGVTPEEAMFNALRKKQQKKDPLARYCPVCKFDSGEEVKIVINEGVLICPECGFKPIMTKQESAAMQPPLMSKGEILSGNVFAENAFGMKRMRLSQLAQGRDSKHRINKRSMMDAVHSVNQIDPFEPDLDNMI
jgi:ferredoxin-like protein FixX